MGPVEYVEVRCKSALNRVRGLPFFTWSINPYAGCTHGCHFCYARTHYTLADHGAADDFATRIFVKTNMVDVLRRELGRTSWARERVALGTATDCYQPAEGRYRLTRGILEALRDARTPVSLLTKSPLVIRDVDVLAELARTVGVQVCFSITTVDLDLWRHLEPGTANPYHRLRAMQRLRAAGVHAGVFMAPILPRITDAEASIAAVMAAARDHGAAFFWATPLRLAPVVKQHYLGFLGDDFPDLLPQYQRAYHSTYAPKAYRDALEERITRLRPRYGFDVGTLDRFAPSAPTEPAPTRGQLAFGW